MGRIEDLHAFVQIVEQESIGKAAETMGVAKSALSRRLRLLEDRMQTQLIARTSRQWALTEAGRQYYERGRDLLADFDAVEGAVRDETRRLSGSVRLSAPLYFGQTTLAGPLLDFANAHPGLQIHADFSDRMVDVVGENYDFVIRIGVPEDSNLIGRRLCLIRHVVVASPAYLRRAPAPVAPQDLKTHRILHFGASKRPRWTFPAGGGTVSVPLSANFNTVDGGLLCAAAESGLGVARLPGFIVRDALRAGRLVALLPDFPLPPRAVHALYPATRYQPRRSRALLDYLAAGMTGD